jgi:hypothetical protein
VDVGSGGDGTRGCTWLAGGTAGAPALPAELSQSVANAMPANAATSDRDFVSARLRGFSIMSQF